MILHGSALCADGGGTTKKLICDRCGTELTEKYDIDLALEGKEAWAASARALGAEPRGIIPCEHFVHCSGQMKLANSRVVRWCRWLKKTGC